MIDVISMRDFSKDEILAVIDASREVKRAVHVSSYDFQRKYGRDVSELLEKVYVISTFVENSTRTYYSSRAAVLKTGGDVDGFPTKDYTSLGKGESWADTAAMFAGYGCDAIVMRSTVEGMPRWTKEFLEKNNAHVSSQHQMLGSSYSFRVPMVINGGDGKNQHPTQCLLDLLTMTEIAESEGRSLDGLEIALLNDIAHSRVLSSLMSVAHLFNFKLHFAYPPRFGPREEQLRDLEKLGVEYHDHGQNKEEAMAAAVIAYHTRPQKERVGKGKDLETITEWGKISQKLYDHLGDKAPYLMHALPVDSKLFEEIDRSMNFHPKNFANFQAANGLYVRAAIVALGTGRMHWPYRIDKQARKIVDTSIIEMPLSEKDKDLTCLRSGYIQNEGIVFDHIPAGRGRRLEGVLGLEHEGLSIVSAYNMTVDNGRKPEKDMIKIHCKYELSPEQLQALALIAPEVTVSLVENGKVKKKFRPLVGNFVENRVKCRNEDCVTNVKEEPVTPKHQVEKSDAKIILRCNYCETTDTMENVYQDQRFIYIKK